MNRFFTTLLGLALISSLSACETPEATPKGTVKGRVVDSQGKPVANAEIVASSTDWCNKTTTGYTDANGNYSLSLPTGVAEGSYTVSGTVKVNYHSKNYTLALYEENSRVFSAYEGAVRNFVFRLTGKRTADAANTDSPLGARLEVHHGFDNVVWENLEITLEPVGPLVDGSTGKKIVTTMPANDYSIYDIPVGQYKISARDKVTGQKLGVKIKDSGKSYAASVTDLFKEANFEGDTNYELILLVDKL